MGLFLTSMAWALDVRLCAQYEVDFEEQDTLDFDPGDASGDGITDNDYSDFMNPETKRDPFPMRGLQVVASRKAASGFWQEAYRGRAFAAGPHAGCTPVFQVDDLGGGEGIVRLAVYSEVDVGVHHVDVFDDATSPNYGHVLSPEMTVPAGRTDLFMGTGDQRFDVAMALAFALVREDGGNASLSLPVYVGDGTGPRYDVDEDAIYLAADNGWPNYVQAALHEFGHAVFVNRMIAESVSWPTFHYGWDNSDGNGDTECPVDLAATDAHYRASDEATVDAILEGFADYYALSILNRRTETDAFLFWAEADWDHDGSDDLGWISWHRRPLSHMPSAMDKDYWAAECLQDVENVSSEYDWARGLWELTTVHGLTTAQILDVFIEADPDSFFVEPGSCQLTPCPTPTQPSLCAFRCPGPEILDAASTLGFGAAWSAACAEGICR